ncbi:MAG: hypothetical protein OD817_00950, partial [Gammaproteobacteria bacterium]
IEQIPKCRLPISGFALSHEELPVRGRRQDHQARFFRGKTHVEFFKRIIGDAFHVCLHDGAIRQRFQQRAQRRFAIIGFFQFDHARERAIDHGKEIGLTDTRITLLSFQRKLIVQKLQLGNFRMIDPALLAKVIAKRHRQMLFALTGFLAASKLAIMAIDKIFLAALAPAGSARFQILIRIAQFLHVQLKHEVAKLRDVRCRIARMQFQQIIFLLFRKRSAPGIFRSHHR